MLYLFELMANATLTKGINAPNQGTQCLFQAVSGNSGSFAAFLDGTQNGDVKNEPT